MKIDDFALSDFTVNNRIELHPATDAWMRGDRYGTIVARGRKYLRVKMDRSLRVIKVSPASVGRIIR